MILVVDDERQDADFMRTALEGAEFDVSTAEDYGTAVETFRAHMDEIDMAVLDVSLPKRNGIELAKDLLKLNRRLKVLFTSGHVGAEVIRFYGLLASSLHFLRKPFRAEALLSRVSEIMKSDEPMRWLKPDNADESSDSAKG